MNEQTTDTREEVALPVRPKPERIKQFATTLMGYRFVQYPEFVRYAEEVEAQLRASILACKKAEAANEDKDAELERIGIALGLSLELHGCASKNCTEAALIAKAAEILDERRTLRSELASIRASVGEK